MNTRRQPSFINYLWEKAFADVDFLQRKQKIILENSRHNIANDFSTTDGCHIELALYPNNVDFGLAALLKYNNVNKNLLYFEPLPVGDSYDINIIDIIDLENENGAIIYGEIKNGLYITFYNPYYYLDKNIIKIGNKINFNISGIALDIKEVENDMSNFKTLTQIKNNMPIYKIQRKLNECREGNYILENWIYKNRIDIGHDREHYCPINLYIPNNVWDKSSNHCSLFESEFLIIGYGDNIKHSKAARHALTKSQLEEELIKVSLMKRTKIEMPRIMCYMMCFHRDVHEYICEECGKKISAYYPDKSDVKGISKIVDDMQSAGYDTKLKKVCGNCANIQDKSDDSIYLKFYFRADGNLDYHVSINNSIIMYRIIYSFLNYKYVVKTSREVYFACEYIEEIENMLGIKIEYSKRGWKQKREKVLEKRREIELNIKSIRELRKLRAQWDEEDRLAEENGD